MKQKENSQKEIKAKDLHQDIDLVYGKLVKYHPQLYRYISPEQLQFKFDSLKASITTPSNAIDFYFKISPVIANIKQGHTSILLRNLKSKREIKKYNQIKYDEYFPFEIKVIHNKVIITKDHRLPASIKSGTELVAVNHKNVDSLLRLYSSCISIDGYNKTALPWVLARRFKTYLDYQEHYSHKLDCKFANKDSAWNVSFYKNNLIETLKIKTDSTARSKMIVAKNNISKPKPEELISKQQNIHLKYLSLNKDVALLQLKSFNERNFKVFYKNCFQSLKQNNTSHLIIDLRNNRGGRIDEVRNLYSYLTDSDFHFVKPFEVSSRFSILKNYKHLYQTSSGFINMLRQSVTIFGIVPTIKMNLHLSKTKSGTYIYNEVNSRLNTASKLNFKGNIYVLINGGTFSAASILAANLKATSKAIFIGEETGGTSDGCVAGALPEISLPNSKLTLRFGLDFIQPINTPINSKIGRGTLPDFPMNSQFDKGDTELNWILNHLIKK